VRRLPIAAFLASRLVVRRKCWSYSRAVKLKLLFLAVCAGVFAGAASGATGDEVALSSLAGRFVTRPVTVHCPDPEAWNALLDTVGVPRTTLGFVPLAPNPDMYLSPFVCSYVTRWINGERIYCSVTRYKTVTVWKQKRVKVHGVWRKKRVRERITQPYQAQAVCDELFERVLALHVFTHESLHVGGLRNEAITDCFALQLIANVAGLAGAPPEEAALVPVFDLELYKTQGPYPSPECRDGGIRR
jgi:hypothetical protein